MKKILIVGSKGQLGADCLSVFGNSAQGLDIPEIDISNRFQCLEKLDEVRPDVVVNCAAYTAVDACESDPSCWSVNADGPKHLAEWVAKNDSLLVHVSTDYVFAGDKPLFESSVETEATAPVSEYGKSKLAGEQAILGSGANAAILRTAWLYGANGKNFLKTMLRLALQTPEKELRVVNDQFGSPTWSYSLARQIAAVVDVQATGIFHATAEGYCSWYDLALRFLTEMNIPFRMAPCSSEEYPTPACRPKNSILENEELKKKSLSVFEGWEAELVRFVSVNKQRLMEEI